MDRRAFTTNTTEMVTQYLENIKVFLIGGGGGGAGTWYSGGSAGFITTATYGGTLSPGQTVTVTIGAGGTGGKAGEGSAGSRGGTTTINIAGTSYSAEGGYPAYYGGGSSGGGGGGNLGGGGNGGSGGSNGGAGATETPGTGMGTAEFTAAINFMSGKNLYNIRAGAGGTPGPGTTHKGGGGGGGVINDSFSYPGNYLRGSGWGAGGSSGGLTWPYGKDKSYQDGGDAARGMVYMFADIIPPVTPTLTFNNMTVTYGNGAFIITQPSTNNSSGSFTYSVIGGNSVSISGTTVTILRPGTTNIRASQAASGNFLAGTVDGTITVYQATPTLTVSKNKYITKYISNDNINFDVFSTNGESGYTRQFSSNNGAIITVPNASSPNVRIVGPGRTTVNVTQYGTTNYATVTINNIIEFVIVGQNQSYTSENMTSIDLSGTNLSKSTFSSCDLTSANLYNATVDASTNLTSSTLTSIKSGRITGFTALLPPNYRML
jgi:hypothetical protein